MTNQPAFPSNFSKTELGLTKLEYALIHGSWEPSKESIGMEVTRDRNKNPHNDSHKPAHRSYNEIIRDLKKQYYTTLLS